MPISSRICPERMARGPVGSFPYGTQAWWLLHRLLLVCDGLALCRWGNELVVGCCYCGVRVARKGGPGRSADGPSCRGLGGGGGHSIVGASNVGWNATRDEPRDGI